jgi:hypothetical protein
VDQRERYSDPPEAYRLAFEAGQTRLWTALPCVVTAFPCASGISKMMLDCQPQIAVTVLNAKGTFDTVQLPPLVDLPIAWPGGGGVTLTFPIKKGDECLVVFASRCIDAWWQQGSGNAGAPGSIALPPDDRMHNLSDGVAYVGVRSKPNEFTVDLTRAQLRTNDGLAAVSINPTTYQIQVTTKANVNITTASGQVNANGVTIDQNGNMVVPGNINCAKNITGLDVLNTAGTSLTSHEHPTAATGPPSPPTPGS